MLNRQKLIKLFVDKQDELGMTQDQLAKWFSDLGGNTVSHGVIQTMTSPKKTSTPEWDNMKTIAKMWNVTLDELNYYFENDEIKDVKEASKAYQQAVSQTLDKGMIESIVIKHLEPEDIAPLAIKLITISVDKMKEQLQLSKKMTEILKQMGLSQIQAN
jgi:hypothetical protein